MKDWKTIIQEKQDERAARIKTGLASISTTPNGEMEDDQFLKATAVQIVRCIQDGEPGWTAERVLTAYIRQAVKAQEATNCLTEVMFAEALEEARLLDRQFLETKQVKGPLHGVPVSFKDVYDIKGFDSSRGFTSSAQKPAAEDAVIVAQVRTAGGIPIAKTNMPQPLAAFVCSNPIFGQTVNPWSRLHGTGGSSGGEGALLACDGSALGFGSDIGGSLRIPASFCGVYSMKPGAHRMSKSGTRPWVPGFEAIHEVKGPMARSVEDIELACRVLFGRTNHSYDDLPPMPYRDVSLPEKLKFGYYKSDAVVKASPAVQRAVQETVDALREQGHECLEIVVPDILVPSELYVSLICADKYKTLLSSIGSDPWVTGWSQGTVGPRLPGFVRRLAEWAFRYISKDTFMASVTRVSRGRDVTAYWAETQRRDDYTKLFYREIWDRFGLDGIICPINALPAPPNGPVGNVAATGLSTALYGVLRCPVGSLPITRVDKSRDALPEGWDAPSEANGSPTLFGKLYGGKTPAYDAEAMHGIPVGVKVAGKHWEDEKVIEMMKVVDGAMGERGFGPGMWGGKAA